MTGDDSLNLPNYSYAVPFCSKDLLFPNVDNSEIYMDERTLPGFCKTAEISRNTVAIWEDGYENLRFVCLLKPN